MKYSILLSVLCILFFSACRNNSAEVATIDLEVPVQFPAGLNTLETHVFQVFNVPTFYNATIAGSGLSEDQIASIQSGFGSFRQSFSSINLDFIRGVTVHVLVDPVSGERRELFYLEQIPLGNKEEVRMLASTTELKEVINKESIDLEFSFRLRDISPQSFTGIFELNFGVFEE